MPHNKHLRKVHMAAVMGWQTRAAGPAPVVARLGPLMITGIGVHFLSGARAASVFFRASALPRSLRVLLVSWRRKRAVTPFVASRVGCPVRPLVSYRVAPLFLAPGPRLGPVSCPVGWLRKPSVLVVVLAISCGARRSGAWPMLQTLWGYTAAGCVMVSEAYTDTHRERNVPGC